ncbi:hypothetical protein [Leptospira interrogans]|uniref:hypothetical protein n=1 Tax=Leptospira interrogans TaxID=173 RepID=UPI0007741813|nr:hypothetical protein [Leptospira interrogans]
MLCVQGKSNKGVFGMAGNAAIAISKEIFDQIVPVVEQATGFRPQIKDFAEKAILKELERIKKSAGKAAKNR